ncbi:MAG: 16S rRNA (guanine(966)-N(2))-methyltransferase RsmD [Pseudomonadota bacterium]
MKGKIRIIGGQWRGRKLQVPEKPGLRPTPNRVRETLFNWLAMDLPGSRCLDLFTGTGALGIEAASRGAKQVILVEKERDVVQGLKQQVATFAPDIEILCADALQFLKGTPETFDIIFLAPPYGHDLLRPTCPLLEEGGWLSPHALIYLETERRFGEPSLPATWQVIRRQKVGQVAGFLVVRE